MVASLERWKWTGARWGQSSAEMLVRTTVLPTAGAMVCSKAGCWAQTMWKALLRAARLAIRWAGCSAGWRGRVHLLGSIIRRKKTAMSTIDFAHLRTPRRSTARHPRRLRARRWNIGGLPTRLEAGGLRRAERRRCRRKFGRLLIRWSGAHDMSAKLTKADNQIS